METQQEQPIVKSLPLCPIYYQASAGLQAGDLSHNWIVQLIWWDYQRMTESQHERVALLIKQHVIWGLYWNIARRYIVHHRCFVRSSVERMQQREASIQRGGFYTFSGVVPTFTSNSHAHLKTRILHAFTKKISLTYLWNDMQMPLEMTSHQEKMFFRKYELFQHYWHSHNLPMCMLEEVTVGSNHVCHSPRHVHAAQSRCHFSFPSSHHHGSTLQRAGLKLLVL